MPPRSAPIDHLGLVQPDHRFGEGVVVGIADTADRRLDARLGEALRVPDSEILRAAIAMMDEPVKILQRAFVNGNGYIRSKSQTFGVYPSTVQGRLERS